jgi:hypothetical protein
VAALAIWVIVIAAAAGLLAIARAMLNRVRNTGWPRDIDNLLCHGGGQPYTQPKRGSRGSLMPTQSKVENLAHAVSPHYTHYNFARPHATLTTAAGG